MELYITVYLFGSTMGPVIGGAIYQFLNWRWIFYIQIIWYCAFIPLFFFTIKETRGSVILKQRAKKIRAATGKKAYTRDELNHIPIWQIIKTSVKRPAYMLFTEWVVFSLTMWSAFSVGLVYLFTQSIEEVFTGLYGWPAYSTGYVQAAVGVGELLGFWAAYANIYFYFRSAKSNPIDPGTPVPEARLYMSLVGGFFGMTGGMFIYAWTSYPDIPWIAPAIGLAVVGFGTNVVVSSIAQYLMDSYSKYAASAIAAVAFGENVFSAFLPLAAQSMYTNLGYRWASSVLAFLSLALACAPIILLLKGPEIRSRSPFIREARYEHDVKDSGEEA
ncbi:MFS general substrate transporter, partial [Aureobasidium melanogenum]